MLYQSNIVDISDIRRYDVPSFTDFDTINDWTIAIVVPIFKPCFNITLELELELGMVQHSS